MKKYQITLLTIMLCFIGKAQTIEDVLRYSTDNTNGSARYSGMSGAFGALGGDLSAINVNPAGSAVFNHSAITATASIFNNENTSTYNGSRSEENSNTADINQFGGVFVLKSNSENSAWKKIVFAVNYDLNSSFKNELRISGNSTYGVDNYFLDNANNSIPEEKIELIELKVLDGEYIEDRYLDVGEYIGYHGQQAFLGYNANIIKGENNTDNNTTYNTNLSYTNVRQKVRQETKGYNSKFTVNAAGQLGNTIFIGASLNFHTLSFEKRSYFDEDGYDNTSGASFVNFDNLLLTEGTGFSLNAGIIAKLNNVVRIGASYQSPTWYRLTDENAQAINTDASEKNSTLSFVNFTTVSVFPDYKIKTPGKINGSLALIFGKNGLLSFDYGFQDMSQATLSPKNDNNFADENNYISNELKEVNSYKIGGEYRVKQLSIRGGYRFEQSPYKNELTVSDLTGYSLGLGYNFNTFRLDLAYRHTEQDYYTQLFAGSDLAKIANDKNNISLSATFNL